jgi:hypothetical protein
MATIAVKALRLILPIMYSQHRTGRFGITPVLSRTHNRILHSHAKNKGKEKAEEKSKIQRSFVCCVQFLRSLDPTSAIVLSDKRTYTELEKKKAGH